MDDKSTSQAFISHSTAEDIKALTRALTTPIEHSDDHQAAVDAVTASIAATVESATQQSAPQPDTTDFDPNQAYNQAPRTEEALQLIALSLNNRSTLTPGFDDPQATTHSEADDTKAEASTPDHSRSDMEGVLKEHGAAQSVTDSLISISHAINFPSAATSGTTIEHDTSAFAQAVINATQSDASKKHSSGALSGSNGENDSAGLDPSALHLLSTTSSNEKAGSSSSASAPAPASQAFTFEVDKATGRTQLKWTPDPREETNVLQDASAIQQALHNLMANSGIPGLADLGVPGGALMAPPLGQFPAQGSQFGTAQDPVVPESNSQPRKKRKASSGPSAGQNTAASIPEGAASYPCTFPGCDKVFARLYNLKSHSRTHTSERPFVCSHCQQAFARNHDLKRHVKIHGGDKPFKCNGCGKSFSRLDALGRHRGNSKNRAGCQGADAL